MFTYNTTELEINDSILSQHAIKDILAPVRTIVSKFLPFYLGPGKHG